MREPNVCLFCDSTGTLRYMAPEVANCEPYDASSDVYSFAILLWQMLALKTPYEKNNSTMMFEEVYNGAHTRPYVPNLWSLPIQICLKRCFSKNPKERFKMDQVVEVLKREVVRVRSGDDSGLEHNTRRSTHIFRRPTILRPNNPEQAENV
jgi:serine/threonine protein kinase